MIDLNLDSMTATVTNNGETETIRFDWINELDLTAFDENNEELFSIIDANQNTEYAIKNALTHFFDL